MPATSESRAGSRLAWGLLAAVLTARLLTMAAYPITDTTEARYAEISRLMLTSGDWLVPQVAPGVPFWGKPPLFAWLTAGAFRVLGIGEFAARLPHFALAMASLWLVTVAAARETAPHKRLLPALVLASTPLFYVSAGTVMTEAGLLFSTTLAMTGFWLCVRHGQRSWGLAFFAGLGMGMLAKGPIALVMSLLPIAMWLLINKEWSRLRLLPWTGGLLLALLICLPWYLAAEYHSPGFLAYFLVGEHLLRFIQPGWEGDLYGNAHTEPLGMIWWFWFQATAAWGLLLAVALIVLGRRTRGGRRRLARNDWRRYLLCWMVAPLLFFTFSSNILWTYVITGLPALALLLADDGVLREARA